jgi:hypothetical protein
VQHKNRDELFKAGSELTEKCEACHKEYKPALPAIRNAQVPQRRFVSATLCGLVVGRAVITSHP